LNEEGSPRDTKERQKIKATFHLYETLYHRADGSVLKIELRQMRFRAQKRRKVSSICCENEL